jgi:hypothetical protein
MTTSMTTPAAKASTDVTSIPINVTTADSVPLTSTVATTTSAVNVTKIRVSADLAPENVTRAGTDLAKATPASVPTNSTFTI